MESLNRRDQFNALDTKSRSFCLGDAVHRHPPFNGLGSNTCIQDAFNLAWKVAYVIQGMTGLSNSILACADMVVG